MLRPSPNHGTQRLPNDDDDDVHISDTDHQNSMTEINSFDIYSRHKQSVYDIMSRKTSPSG